MYTRCSEGVRKGQVEVENYFVVICSFDFGDV